MNTVCIRFIIYPIVPNCTSYLYGVTNHNSTMLYNLVFIYKVACMHIVSSGFIFH